MSKIQGSKPTNTRCVICRVSQKSTKKQTQRKSTKKAIEAQTKIEKNLKNIQRVTLANLKKSRADNKKHK